MGDFRIRALGCGAVLAVYILVFLTSDIQEDAYITFRIAFNLADHGELSFNLGESYNGATSFFYPLLVAGLRLIAGDWAIPLAAVANSFAIVGSAWFLGSALSALLEIEERHRFWLFLALSVLPVGLLAAVRSMETCWVIVLTAMGFEAIARGRRRWRSMVPMLLLPFVRPDAIAFSLLIAAYDGLSAKSLPRLLSSGLAAVAGAGLLVLANLAVFGQGLPASMVAKSSKDNITLDFGEILGNAGKLFLDNNIYAPISTKVISPFSPVFTLVGVGLFAILLLVARRRSWNAFSFVATAGVASFAVPLCYALGVMYAWYVWPSQFIFQSLMLCLAFVLFQALRTSTARRLGAFAIVALLAVCVVLRLVTSLSSGTEEARYRASVGKYVAGIAQPDDRLFLEPAGYIPFHAGLYTIDEVGLASRHVTEAKARDPVGWWFDILRSERPELLVQRPHILENRTYQGYAFTPEQAEWFERNYEICRVFSYRPEDYFTNPILLPILKLGTHSDYIVLARADLGRCAPSY